MLSMSKHEGDASDQALQTSLYGSPPPGIGTWCSFIAMPTMV